MALQVVLAQRTEVRRPGLSIEDVRRYRALHSAGKITAEDCEKACYLAGKPGDVVDVECSDVNLLASNGMIRPLDVVPTAKEAFEKLCSKQTLQKLEELIRRQTRLSELQLTQNEEFDTDPKLVKRAEEARAARLDPVPKRTMEELQINELNRLRDAGELPDEVDPISDSNNDGNESGDPLNEATAN